MPNGNLILTVDCGNTNIKLGVFEGQNLTSNFRISTDIAKTSDEYAVLLRSLLSGENVSLTKFEGAVISSVVPPLLPMLERAIEKVLSHQSLVVKPGIKTGIVIMAENPKELGSDLLSLAVGATVRHSLPAIIVSLGTATAFIAISKRNEILGVAIAPGIISAADSLSMQTAKLPKIELGKPETALGRNTIDSMKSGIVYGFAGLVDRVVMQMASEMEEQPTIVATGGLLNIISSITTSISRFDPFLSLYGLKTLYDKNMEHR